MKTTYKKHIGQSLNQTLNQTLTRTIDQIIVWTTLFLFCSPVFGFEYNQNQNGWNFEVRHNNSFTSQTKTQTKATTQTKAATNTLFDPVALKKWGAQRQQIEQTQVQTTTTETAPESETILKYITESLAIKPTGKQTSPAPEQCRGRVLERKILQAHGQLDAIAKIIKNHISSCEKWLTRDTNVGFISLLNVSLMNYDISEMAGRIPFQLTAPNNEKIQGVILHKKTGVRPWVIIKCGVFCEAETSPSAQNMFMHLFDEAPFNVMALNNDVSNSSIITNKRVNVSGFYEGQELYAAAYWLKYVSPFKDEVASIHGVGISLGGNATLFASLYNDANPIENKKLFDSFIAYCPVVDLGRTILDNFQNNLKGFLFSNMTWKTVKAVHSQVEDVQEEFSLQNQPKIKEYPNRLGSLSLKYMSRKSLTELLKPFQFLKPISEQNQLWDLSNFLELAYGLQTPTLVFSSEDDWVVSNSINSARLAENFNSDPNTNLRVVTLKHGNHCGSSLVYNWQPISQFFRSYFMAFTDEAKFTTVENSYSFKLPHFYMGRRDVIADYDWLVTEDSDEIALNIKVWNPKNSPRNCIDYSNSGRDRARRNQNPYTSDRQCYRIKTVRAPYSWLKNFDIQQPTNEAEAQALSRFLNSHFELMVGNESAIGSQKAPNGLRAREYKW